MLERGLGAQRSRVEWTDYAAGVGIFLLLWFIGNGLVNLVLTLLLGDTGHASAFITFVILGPGYIYMRYTNASEEKKPKWAARGWGYAGAIGVVVLIALLG